MSRVAYVDAGGGVGGSGLEPASFCDAWAVWRALRSISMLDSRPHGGSASVVMRGLLACMLAPTPNSGFRNGDARSCF